MSMFDLPRITPSKNIIPDWVVNDNERLVFKAVNLRITEIENLVSISDTPLKPTEFKIAKSKICKELGLSESYIAKHKLMKNWVDGHQRRLKRIASDIEEKVKKRAYTAKKPEQMRKDELVTEVKQLRKDINQRNSELYVEQLKELMDSGLAESQVITQERFKYLEEKINQLQEMNAKLEVNNKRLTDNLIEAIKEHKKLGSTTLKSVT